MDRVRKVDGSGLAKPNRRHHLPSRYHCGNIPAPEVSEGSLQMQITSLDFSSFTGRIAIGRVTRGQVKICLLPFACATAVLRKRIGVDGLRRSRKDEDQRSQRW